MQHIQVRAKEWFDKANGNSYFSARIFIDGKTVGVLPFQYGYGDHYLDMACQFLDENGIIDNPRHENGTRTSLWRYCEENGIALDYSKMEGCKARETRAFGKEG